MISVAGLPLDQEGLGVDSEQQIKRRVWWFHRQRQKQLKEQGDGQGRREEPGDKGDQERTSGADQR